jgi:8-oxo-dGTP pyrophosphatase MutT (NUDIX family)
VQASAPIQRLGAYAVVLRDESLLLARVSPRGFPAGWWGLPGGGVDHGESPADAMIRELYEEAGLAPETWRLVDVHDIHTVSPGPGDVYEDYHGVHLLYAVTVDSAVEPRVVETDGTTDLVQWVSLGDLAAGRPGPLLPVVEHVLAHRDEY